MNLATLRAFAGWMSVLAVSWLAFHQCLTPSKVSNSIVFRLVMELSGPL